MCSSGEAGRRSFDAGTALSSSILRLLILLAPLINSPKKIKELIDKFSNKEIDIIVATQIMAKGYDFPNLSLVSIAVTAAKNRTLDCY